MCVYSLLDTKKPKTAAIIFPAFRSLQIILCVVPEIHPCIPANLSVIFAFDVRLTYVLLAHVMFYNDQSCLITMHVSKENNRQQLHTQAWHSNCTVHSDHMAVQAAFAVCGWSCLTRYDSGYRI